MKTTLRRLTVAWLLVTFLVIPTLTRAETAVQAWVQRYNPGNNGSSATALAVDGSNNVIVTGYSAGSGSTVNYATIKYSSAGVPLWTNRSDWGGLAMAMAVDNSNSVIVTGYSATGSPDYLTIKYSSAGVPLWTNRYDGPGNYEDHPKAVAVDGSNNVIVTGYSYAYNFDYLTIKYSSAGVPLWTNRYSGSGISDDQAKAVAVDGNNDVIVTGYSSTGFPDYLTIKYSSAGVPLWTNLYNKQSRIYAGATAVAVDGSNNVIVTGHSDRGEFDDDFATIKYSSAGVPLWTNLYDRTENYDDFATAVAVDGSNNVIVTGYSYTPGGSDDYSTIKYSSEGVPLWTNCYNGPGYYDDIVTALAVDGSNNVIVTGSSGPASSISYATIKYSSAGVPLWTNRYDGPGSQHSDNPSAVAVDHNNNVIVTGGSGLETYRGFATVKYICVKEPVMNALQPTNGTFQLRVDDVLQPGTLVIEAATNLAGWLPIFTNITPTNVIFYTDPDAGSLSKRYYRAFQYP